MIELEPTPDYRKALKEGMEGTDVAALQINLGGLVVDGKFGAKTTATVRALQNHAALLEDGIAGLLTQRALIRQRCSPVQTEEKLPGGMLLSLAANESGFQLAACSPLPGGGFDLGAFQHSFPKPGSQEAYRNAYSVKVEAELHGGRLRERHDAFTEWDLAQPNWYLQNIGEGRGGRFAWQMAVLSHNWPEAAYNIWKIGSIDKEAAKDTQPREWIAAATGGNLRTPREWAVAYVERATVYVDWRE